MQKLTAILNSIFLVVILTLGTNAGAASAGASFIDICANGQEGPHPFDCEIRFSQMVKQRVIVSITPDSEHAGRIGAFYVGVRTDGQIRGNLTPNGWIGFQGGLFEPAAIFESLPGGTQQYVVLDGGLLCPQIGGGTSEVWAGYGFLNNNSEVIVKNYQKYLSKGITYEHLVRTYVQQEMTKSERAWKVLEVNCQSGYGDGGN